MKQTRRHFVRTLFVATQATVVGRYLYASPAVAGRAGINFLVIGDWGREGEADQAEVAAQMGITADAVPARFVISVGDNFYEDGVASTKDPLWQSSFEKVYT